MKMILYHGSRGIIGAPEFGEGNPHNDYGLGFYCTENLELAKEWASSEDSYGYVNIYELDLDGLTVCNLSKDYNILKWIAILLENRTFELSSDTASIARDYLLKSFLPTYKKYDLIIGYRADDSYFSFAKDFLNNSISLKKLSEAMRLGKLGEQIVLKSKEAFDKIRFIGSEQVNNSIYFPKKKERDAAARSEYKAAKKIIDIENEVYVIDILREKWESDDARIQ